MKVKDFCKKYGVNIDHINYARKKGLIETYVKKEPNRIMYIAETRKHVLWAKEISKKKIPVETKKKLKLADNLNYKHDSIITKEVLAIN
jgi:hypothetical protein